VSQSITDRLNGIVRAKVKSLALGQSFGYDVSACYAPQLNDQGQMSGLAHSWLVTVSLPNPLVGQPDMAVSLPVNGVVPPEPIFEKAAEMLYSKLAEEKDKLMAKPNLGMDLSKIGQK
jgi:hypothetical protein